ncbi:MAG: hypothetical protein JNK51_04040 [Blastocatellia bacterium]|nr:hypothetical protein [Blastocatellia bacterium]
MKCLACGSGALVPGTLLDSGDGGKPAFKLDEVPTWKSLFGLGTRAIRGYGCVHCGHLHLAVDFSEKDKASYRQFEGEQPGVLERINSEPEKLD